MLAQTELTGAIIPILERKVHGVNFDQPIL